MDYAGRLSQWQISGLICKLDPALSHCEPMKPHARHIGLISQVKTRRMQTAVFIGTHCCSPSGHLADILSLAPGAFGRNILFDIGIQKRALKQPALNCPGRKSGLSSPVGNTASKHNRRSRRRLAEVIEIALGGGWRLPSPNRVPCCVPALSGAARLTTLAAISCILCLCLPVLGVVLFGPWKPSGAWRSVASCGEGPR